MLIQAQALTHAYFTVRFYKTIKLLNIICIFFIPIEE